MKTTKFIKQTSANYENTDHKGEVLSGKSMTLPDESYTIREILEKFTMGYELPQRQGEYSNTDDFDDVHPVNRPDFDLSDVTSERQLIMDEIDERKAKKRQAATKAGNGNGPDDGSEADIVKPADV